MTEPMATASPSASNASAATPESQGTLRHTPLYDVHRALGARMVPFAGWEMPVQYASIIDEHRTVRTAVGLFDLSHMGELLISGPDALAFLGLSVLSDSSCSVSHPRPRRCGKRSASRARASASSRADWEAAIPFGSRPACRSMATNSIAITTPTRPTWAGR